MGHIGAMDGRSIAETTGANGVSFCSSTAREAPLHQVRNCASTLSMTAELLGSNPAMVSSIRASVLHLDGGWTRGVGGGSLRAPADPGRVVGRLGARQGRGRLRQGPRPRRRQAEEPGVARRPSRGRAGLTLGASRHSSMPCLASWLSRADVVSGRRRRAS